MPAVSRWRRASGAAGGSMPNGLIPNGLMPNGLMPGGPHLVSAVGGQRPGEQTSKPIRAIFLAIVASAFMWGLLAHLL